MVYFNSLEGSSNFILCHSKGNRRSGEHNCFPQDDRKLPFFGVEMEKIKQCSRCKQWKFLPEFDKNRTRSDGYMYWCKVCSRTRIKTAFTKKYHSDKNFRLEELRKNKEWREQNRERRKAYMKKYDRKNKLRRKLYTCQFWKDNKKRLGRIFSEYTIRCVDAWKLYLPKNPKCEICGQKLLYFSGDTKLTVHFDHKKEGLPIKKDPNNFLTKTFPKPEKIKIWEECNFGFLCRSCNHRLPTKNRKEWFMKAFKYATQ